MRNPSLHFTLLAGAAGVALLSATGAVAAVITSGDTFTASGVLVVGDAAPGQLTIDEGSDLTSEGVTISNQPAGTGVATVTGTGSSWTSIDNATFGSAFINVGSRGHGTLNILDGATVTSQSVTAGRDDGGVGVINIDGAGSLLRLETASATGDPGGTIGRFAGSDGTLNVTGGGRIEVDGTTGVAGGFSVARESGSVGAMTVSGAGSEISIVGNANNPGGDGPGMTVGVGGVGTLAIADGGKISINGGAASNAGFSVGGRVANGAISSSGTVTVDGIGSELNVRGDSPSIAVGHRGLGDLSLSNGAVARSLDLFVGLGVGSQGELTIGETATLELSGVDTDGTGPVAIVGGSGTGRLNVAGGGLEITGAAAPTTGLAIGGASALPGGVGAVEVTAGGSVAISGSNSFLQVGGTGGQASLSILEGGEVAVLGGGRGAIAATADSIGTVVVDGVGSMLDSGAFLGVGMTVAGTDSGGAALLNVRNGGVVKAGEVTVGSNGALSGNGTVQANVTVAGGAVQAGNSPGTLTIDGDFTFNAGVLEIEIAGFDPGEFDVIDVTGAANVLGGTILFKFLDGFLPETGDFLDFLVADLGTNLSGASFAVEGLAAGFQFQVSDFGAELRFAALTDGEAVPEPETMLLLALGLLGLGFARRRPA